MSDKRGSRMYLDTSEVSQEADKKKEKKKRPEPEKITPFKKIGYEDMTKMEDMDLDGVLANLKERYENELIYTYTSSILVAINPFKRLPIYSRGWVKHYKGKRLGLLSPHIFAVAEQTYNQMCETGQNQSVLVSGESGAGKTESTKLILQFLAARTDRESNVENMVLESIPVLEAFGNAKTGRNDNSSRFGKFIEIQFDTDRYICGSKITQYLLEKSRIITQAKGERNYHIFYQLTEGAEQSMKDTLLLKGAKDYNYTGKTGCIKIKSMDEPEELQMLIKAMKLFDIGEVMQMTVFKIVAACIHLGQASFKADGEVSIHANDSSKKAQENACSLLEFDNEGIFYALTHKKIKMRTEIINTPLTPQQAKDQTDAMVKYLYSTMFEWLVNKLNQCTYADISESFIGVLDIFGFELFEHNSFEQFLINYANEKLQNFFNHHIFKLEQVEYEREGIDWTAIDFVDNQPCLDLIESRRPPGIIAILDEETKFPRATDETFIAKLHSNFEKKHDYYEKPRLARDKFIVKHYAGAVEYETPGWRDKNKDQLPENLVEMVRKSANKFIAILYAPGGTEMTGEEEDAPAVEEEDDSGKGSKLTLGGQFKNSLTTLMDMLMTTTPYFIRCVKPNMDKVPEKFDSELIYNQLLYAGMLETIRIRRMGYPIRYIHEDFWKRYRVICPEVDLTKGDYAKSCTALLKALGLNSPGDFQLGKTKVFLKQNIANDLEDKRNLALTDIILKMQTWWRMMGLRVRFVEKQQGSRQIQTWWRFANKRGKFVTQRKKALLIQRWWRMLGARKELLAMIEKKRKEEEERKRKEEEARKKRIKEKGEAAVLEEEAKAAEEKAAADAEEIAKFKALAEGDFGESKEEAPADGEEAAPKPEKKKKKKKERHQSIMMKKGEALEIPINVDGRITLGLGWKGGQWDMDASCLAFRFKQHRDDVYYYKPRSKDGAVIHRGGYAGLIRVPNVADQDAEQIDLNLQKISPKTNTLIFVVTVFSPEGNFSSVEDAYCRIIDSSTQLEYCRYTLDKGGDETARIMCKLFRYGFSKWRLQAIGEPSEGRLYKHMIPRVEPFLDIKPKKRKFRVRVHRGKLTDIKRMYKGSKTTSLNTFCEIRFDIDKAKTKVVKRSLNPQWRSTKEVTGHGHILEVNVMHRIRFGKEVKRRLDYRLISSGPSSDAIFLGRCLIPLEGDNVQIKDQWFRLEQRDKSKARNQTAVTGDVKLTIQELLI